MPIAICNFYLAFLKIEIGSGEDLPEEFLQQRLYPNKSLIRLQFSLPQGPEKRKPSSHRRSPDISIRTSSCDRRKSSMARFVDGQSSPHILIRTSSCDKRKRCTAKFVDDSNIATGGSVFTGFLIFAFNFVSFLVRKVKAIFSFATRF